MSNDVKLEGCPLCGGPAQIIAGAPGCYYVRCEGCSVTSDDGSRERVITAWNTRHQPQREAVLVTDEMVESALKARVPGGSNVWEWLPQADAWTPHQTARVVMRCALEAALTTPASAVSADDQPQREAVLEAGDIEWLRKELFAAKLLASHQSQKRIERILAALTTPAPAVSRDDQALFNDICDKMAEVLKPLPGEE